MNTKIIDYIVVSKTSPRELQDAVKEYLREGWQPQGGVAVIADSNLRLHYQALVRYQQGD
jgi:hypothetical protein